MASTVLTALFTAEEEISDALDEISVSSSNLEDSISDLSQDINRLGNLSDISEENLDKLRSSTNKLQTVVDDGDMSIQGLARTMRDMRSGAITADEATEQLRSEMQDLSTSAQIADDSSDQLRRTLQDLSESGAISHGWLQRLDSSISDVNRSSVTANQSVDTLLNTFMREAMAAAEATDETTDYSQALAGLNAASFAASGSQSVLANAVDETGDEMEQTSRKVTSLAGDLSVLNAIASTSAFEFSSLSLNVGPFNIALRNFVTQVPAILTGMSTMLALVTSLIAAFVTLGAVTGALVIGGALAFFEEFSKKFEESAQAVQALMDSLQELFMQALEPLMTEANMDLFISAVNGAARAVNMFAQFAQQMRGDVLGVLSEINTDASAALESLHDSFEMMKPILIAFINFFIAELPKALTRFSRLTKNIGGEVASILKAFGRLTAQLLDFASVILTVVTPAVVAFLNGLTGIFAALNALPDWISKAAISALGLIFVVSLLTIKLHGLIGAILGATTAMAGQVATGTLLGQVYGYLVVAASTYTTTSQNLGTVLIWLTKQIAAETAAYLSNLGAKIKNSLATKVLTTATLGLISALKSSVIWLYQNTIASETAAAAKAWLSGALLSSIAFLFGEAAAAYAAAAGLYLEAAAASAAATATWAFNAAIATLTSIGWVPIAIILGLVGALVYLVDVLTGGAISGAIAGFFGGIVSWVGDVIGKIMELLNLTGKASGKIGDVGGVTNVDDIQTNPNVDLSFEETTENNMKVDANPEDKQQISRVVKDAMEEANSLDRRRNGFTGN